MKQRIETQRRKAHVIRLTATQLVIALIGMLAALWADGLPGVASVILGALVALLPQAFFIQRLGILRDGRRASKAVNLFRAEAGKFGLTVALFTAVFVAVPPSNPAFFFSTYVAIILAHWLTPLMPKKSHN
ncbi:ATP synthase protein I [Vreelandella songnenensis]|uniref:ATP synthase protein I n=1 Tax=Vreelandella songnenensis TaxID=1176243 RepID=A0A2T0V3J8_9GAMM|nr:ATP synthase subunit I [Halomonas songnenensis]PRY64769.1 ATP synthase protein I [Halomonas songnenensis]